MKKKEMNIMNKKEISVTIAGSYENADIQKQQICTNNKNKTGIYRWTHVISGKSYVGSFLDIFIRFKNYFNISYLERESKTNNSLIYRALLKYGYSGFKVDILEYCDPSILVHREQYYLDNLELQYNTLKVARSLARFKHSVASIERISLAKIGNPRTEATKLSANTQAHAIIVTQISTGEKKVFTSIRKAAKFIGIHFSYLAKCLNVKNIYTGHGYTIVKNN